MSKVIAVVGGQYGSEGKGVVAADLAKHIDIHVRTGGPNAGHSFIFQAKGSNFEGDGITGTRHKIVMQQLPCGWTNPEAQLVLGPGAVISPDILERELSLACRFFPDTPNRTFIDPNATILTPEDAAIEGHTEGMLHERIGSTGEGVGSARLKKMERCIGPMISIASQVGKWAHPIHVTPTIPKMRQWLSNGHNLLLEGTQGYGLSLHLGQWPYVTTANCTAQQMASDAGVPYVDECIMVIRTHPIRVAGNSGPLVGETSWEAISHDIGRDVTERTTVTKKTRRVGHFNMEAVVEAAWVNGATGIVLTFVDYLGEGNENVTEWDFLTTKAREWVNNLAVQLNRAKIDAPILALGTGFSVDKGWTYIDMGWNDWKRYNIRPERD